MPVMAPSMPASSVGRMILVAVPLAITWRASRYLMAMRPSSGLPSWIAAYTERMASASPSATMTWRNRSASATWRIASAWPSASRICCRFWPCGEDRRLTLTVGGRHCCGAAALGLRHHRTPGALGLHLLVHGRHHVGGRVDALDLHADHPHAPLVGGVVEDLAQVGVDRVDRKSTRLTSSH